MKFKHIMLLMMCFGLNTSFAQNIAGIIKSSTGQAINTASISVLNRSIGTTSNKDGNFTLNLNQGDHLLQISAVGYATKIVKCTVSNNPISLEIILSNQTQTLGEVVVTANKREENLATVSTAITSISSKKVEDARIWNLGGLTALVPNYTYQELGVPFQQVQSIRGIQVFSENPAVATYIDDVNNLDILANGFALTDIERIEILRGPQGTLFGRNAMGGVINIITKKPTNLTTGNAEISLGNLGLQRYSLGYKTPIQKDKLFVGWNALYQTQNGYWKNDTTGTGTMDGTAHGKMVGGEKNLYGNIYLKWLPNHRFNLMLNVKGQKDWSNNTGFFVSQQNETIAFAHPNKINLARIGEHERQILNTSLVAKYLSNAFTITSISAIQQISLSFKNIDFPGFYHSFYKQSIGEKLPPQQVYSQEIRINSLAERKLQYTAGIYGFAQVGYEPSTNLAFELAPNNYSIFRNKSNNAGIAAFGEMSFQLSKDLKITAGLRYDHEKREATFNGFGDASFVNGTFTIKNPDTTVSGNYTALSPKLTLNYSIHDHAILYASYTKGFRAGGVNAQKLPMNVQQTFDPEYSNNYELGLKAHAANHKFNMSVSAFFIQWQQLQFFNLVAPFTYARENVGDAQSMGVEVEIAAIPFKGLQIDGSLGINDTKYKEFDLKRVNFFTGNETTTSIGGNRLSNAPRHTLFIGTQYEHPLSKKIKAVARGEIRNIGNYYTDIQNQIQQPSYTLLNARLGMALNKFSIFLWGQNLNNERFLAFGNPDSSFGRSVRTAAPRTFGLTFQKNF